MCTVNIFSQIMLKKIINHQEAFMNKRSRVLADQSRSILQYKPANYLRLYWVCIKSLNS